MRLKVCLIMILKINSQVIYEIKAFHQGLMRLTDKSLDRILGLTSEDWPSGRMPRLSRAAAFAQFHRAEESPYRVIREIFRIPRVIASDHIVDLGSGRGRVLLYGAILLPAMFTGFEVLPVPYRISVAAARYIGLKNISLIHEDMLSTEIPNASCFILMNSMRRPDLKRLIVRLWKISVGRKTTLITYSDASDVTLQTSWREDRSFRPRTSTACAHRLRCWHNEPI